MKYFSPTRFIQNRIITKVGGNIASGMFKGLKFANTNVAAASIPTLLGTYEKELFVYFEPNFLKKYSNFIDIGAGEGFFVCGALQNNPNLFCFAYEMNPKGRDLIKINTNLNGVEKRVEINGAADAETLAKKLASLGAHKNLILVDIEGAEKTLLDTANYPIFLEQDYIIEVHECFVEGISEELKAKFLITHELHIITATERKIDDFPLNDNKIIITLLKNYYVRLMNEGRPLNMQWFIFIRK